MMNISQLRKKYRPASPIDVLDDLVVILNHPKTQENYSAPLLTITMSSGATFRAYLINGTSPTTFERSYLFSLEMVNQGEGANDLIYIKGENIESVTIWNVDDYPGTLPRFEKKPAASAAGTETPPSAGPTGEFHEES